MTTQLDLALETLHRLTNDSAANIEKHLHNLELILGFAQNEETRQDSSIQEEDFNALKSILYFKTPHVSWLQSNPYRQALDILYFFEHGEEHSPMDPKEYEAELAKLA